MSPRRKTNGIPIVRPPVLDLGHLTRDPIGRAIDKVDETKRIEAWGAAFEANAKQGAASLLAFLLAGSIYGPETVYKTATEIIAAMRAGGYFILRSEELQATVEAAVAEVKARQEAQGDQG